MLGFFRKYQKFMFIIVTFFIVVSFVFFGTSNTIGPSEEAAPNKPIGKLVDGSTLMERDFRGMIRLLQHGIEEGGRDVNLYDLFVLVAHERAVGVITVTENPRVVAFVKVYRGVGVGNLRLDLATGIVLKIYHA